MSCSDCLTHQVSSSDYFKKLASRPRSADDLPISGSLELTPRCNLRCRHCYISLEPSLDRGGRAEARPSHNSLTGSREGRAPARPQANPEMTTEEIRVILQKLSDAGVLSLLLTGGEVFLRHDFLDIYLRARDMGFIVTLFTNAVLVDTSLADFLAAHPPRRIEVTIYGHTEKTYEAVTQAKGSFKRFRQGVQSLLDRKLPVHFKAMVLQSNSHEFEEIRAWAEQRGPFRYDPLVGSGLNRERAPLAERLPASEAAEFLQIDDTGGKTFRKLREFANENPVNDALIKCGAGTRTFHVDWQGRLHPCLMLRTDPYDLIEGSVHEWNSRVEALRAAPAPEDSLCNACPHRFACGTCAATSFLESGKAGMQAPYFCDVCTEREKIADSSSSMLNIA